MAFQMFIIIGLGVFVGKKLDTYFEFEKAVMTPLFALLGLGLAFYLIIKDLSRP